MRYFMPMAVAVLLIAVGGLFVWHTHHSIKETIRETLRREQRAGTLPPDLQGIDLDAAELKLPDLQMKIPSGLQFRMQLAMWMTDLWYIWVPVVLVAALGVTALVSRDRTAPNLPTSP